MSLTVKGFDKALNDFMLKEAERLFGLMREEKKALKEMTTENVQQEFKNVGFERRGDKIVLPVGMSYDTGIEWLKRQKKAEETIVNISYGMKGYPLDGAFALYRALNHIYGFVDLVATPSMFGPRPPKMIGVKLADGSIKQVPWGRQQMPGFDSEEYIVTDYNPTTFEFTIGGQVRKKHEGEVEKIAKLTEKYLREESIYKGQAIRVDLSFLDSGSYNYMEFSDPEFINVKDLDEDRVLMSNTARTNYDAVLLRIERTQDCIAQNIPLKHGCLLAGPYGTGKTMTAKLTAKKAVEHGWTFIYLEDAQQLGDALRFARMYAPAVIFAEDIDKATEGGRTEELNKILNTLDGVDTKNNPIITVLTTNHIENINKAFLRAGRIDTLIYMGPLDESTARIYLEQNLVDEAGRTLLAVGESIDEAARELSGIVPAFAHEVINKAKVSAMRRVGREIAGQVTSSEVINAIHSLKEHIRLTTETVEPSPNEQLGQAYRKVVELSVE